MLCTPLFKHKRVRLKGKALAQLNSDIHKRDGGKCIICGRSVDLGEKFHHEPQGANKSDEIDKGVTLCSYCHGERHRGARSQLIKNKCVEYLNKLYLGSE